MALAVKKLPANAGDKKDADSILGSRRSPGGGNGNPLQYVPRESHGQKSLVGYSPWDRNVSDLTEQLTLHQVFFLAGSIFMV